MRYLAQRVGTGEWLDRDLPLSQVTRTRTLSGPGGITATVEPDLRTARHTDGLLILEGWGTMLYAADEGGAGQIRCAGIVVDSDGADDALTVTAPGFTTYPHGYIYDDSRIWGPAQGTGTVSNPQYPRPDPLQIVQDHWEWIQAQPDSDLGVRLVGDLKSSERVGSYEEPYRLRWWDYRDLGEEIDNLASGTPFEYVEEHSWDDAAHLSVDHRVRLGWPRLGRKRTDLRFADGENIAQPVSATATGGGFANDVIGIGNGEGRKMVLSRSTVRDGRLRRHLVVTDKTARQARMDKVVRDIRERMVNTIDIASLVIFDHPNAPISAIDPGDDIYVQTSIPAFGGDIAMWLRVLSITEDDTVPGQATLATQRSSAFVYSATLEVST